MIDGRPSRDQILMRSADLWSLRSTCSRAQVGVVIASRDWRPLVSGYNGAPAKMPHCDHPCSCRREESRRLRTLQIYSRDNATLWVDPGHEDDCVSLLPCVTSVHGEANAIAYAAREGVCINDSQLFTTVAPCYPCAQLIINAGIYRVVYQADHRDMRGVDLLATAGLSVEKYAS
jgi:dCMP deaminase